MESNCKLRLSGTQAAFRLRRCLTEALAFGARDAIWSLC
jgi:hypothetical protein